MRSKICSVIHAAGAAALCFYFFLGNYSSDMALRFLFLPAALVAVGCWKHWRWMVALGAIPILLVSFAFFVVAAWYNTTLRTNELGFVLLLAVLVWIVEIISFLCAGKLVNTDPSDEPDIYA